MGAMMYYEEKWISGKLVWRGTPNGEWKDFSPDQIMKRLEALETAKKTVPMAMLAHIATMGRSLAGSDKNEQDSKKLSIIASIYGYEVTE